MLFLGYNSKSYELIRKLRLNNVNLKNVELIHIPETDDIALPSIIIEDIIDGKLLRKEIHTLNDLSYYIDEADFRVELRSDFISIV